MLVKNFKKRECEDVTKSAQIEKKLLFFYLTWSVERSNGDALYITKVLKDQRGKKNIS